MTDSFRPSWMFEPKNGNKQPSSRFPHPRIEEPEEFMRFDPEEFDYNVAPSWLTLFTGMVIASWLLGLAQGTLMWVILEALEDIAVVDRHIPWWPIVTIAVALNMIRLLDRGVFRRSR